MIRRSFVKSISALSISPFFSWINILSWFKGVEEVKDGVKEIIAIINNDEPGFQLHWENPIPFLDAGPPKNWTWRKYLIDAYGELEESLTKEYLNWEWELKQSDLDKPCPQVTVDEWWYGYGMTTTSDVFYYLLGVKLSDDVYNQLKWYECPNPGSSYVGVEVWDEETLYKLERELNEQGQNVKFKVIEDWDELD